MENNEKKSSKGRILILCVLIVLSVMLIAFIVISPYFVAMKLYEKEAKQKVDARKDAAFNSAKTSIVFDKDGKEIAVFESELDKHYVYSENMSEELKNAFVMLIDSKYFKNKGAKDSVLIKIAKDDRKAKKNVEGISPLTRIVARDLFLSYDLEKDNSVIEVFVANQLEKSYSKDKILEMYLNNVYFNNGFYGIGAASRGYFDKEVSELTVSEMAYLAAVAEDAQLSPYEDMESLLVKRNVIITRLHDSKVINKDEYLSAISQRIVIDSRREILHNYVESYVIQCAVRRLMQEEGFVFRYSFDNEAVRSNYDREYAKSYNRNYGKLYREGYRIYTGFDMELQEKLQGIVDSTLSVNNTITNDYKHALEGAAVCIDNSTGVVIALVGGRSVETDKYVFNRAFEKYSVAGTVITPLNVYTPYIEWHHNPEYIIYQEEAVDGTFINKVTLREAILRYSDDFASTVYEQLKPQYALSVLNRIGFTKAMEAGKTKESHSNVFVSPVEIAAGYETLANDGVYKEADCITRITDNVGVDVYVRAEGNVNAYAANDSRIMTEILAYNMTEGHLKGYAPSNAVTAGLSSNGIFAGYSAYYTVATYATLENITDNIRPQVADVNTTALAGNMYKKLMEELHVGKTVKEFPKSGPYSNEEKPSLEILQPTTERPSLGGIGGHPGDGDDYLR